MYVNVKIGDKSIAAMVDIDATHTFVASNIVQTYRLKVTKCATRIKAVNSTTQPSYCIMLDVQMTIGHCTATHN